MTVPSQESQHRNLRQDLSSGDEPAAYRERSIGHKVRIATDRILAWEKGLLPMVDGPTQRALEQTSDTLQGHAYRIAIIGQMKAGKSSLINALIERDDLIPTDVNPWTAVTTQLHFAAPAGPEKGMAFKFFNKTEWRYLSEEGGPLGAMVARLGPGVQREELIRQLTHLREQAERRLSSNYRDLLGTVHEFDDISTNVLLSYVAAGDPNDDLFNPTPVGKYADITKTANVYLEAKPFACPTILVDTPGTNDPLLIRDEITHAQLGLADIHVVVLNAQQAMSTADLTLLRMLQGLHKDRIVVFVNRADSLRDVTVDGENIKNSVLERLAIDFPGVDIPVIVGSAYWGQLALNLNDSNAGGVLTPRLLDYARHLGIVTAGEIEFWQRSRKPAWRRVRDVVRQCSAIPALGDAISELTFMGPFRTAATRTTITLAAITRGAEASMVNELRALKSMKEATKGDKRSSLRQLGRLQEDVERLQILSKDLRSVDSTLAQDLTVLRDVGLDRLRTELESVVDIFAESEVGAMEQVGASYTNERVWRCDTRPLRRKMETSFLARYRQLAQNLIELQAMAAGEMRTMLDHAVPGYDIDVGDSSPHLVDPSPSISALGRVVALDLGRPWAQWWRLWRASDARAEKLKALIVSEFEPLVGILVQSAKKELDDHVDQACDRFQDVIRSTIETLQRRQIRLIVVYKDLLIDRRSKSPAEMSHRHDKRIAECRKQIGRYQTARGQLVELMADMDIETAPLPSATDKTTSSASNVEPSTPQP